MGTNTSLTKPHMVLQRTCNFPIITSLFFQALAPFPVTPFPICEKTKTEGGVKGRRGVCRPSGNSCWLPCVVLDRSTGTRRKVTALFYWDWLFSAFLRWITLGGEVGKISFCYSGKLGASITAADWGLFLYLIWNFLRLLLEKQVTQETSTSFKAQIRRLSYNFNLDSSRLFKGTFSEIILRG